MAAAIDESQVRHIARLARLNLSEAEVQRFSGQLAAILDYVKQLQEVDTSSVEPLVHPLALTDVLREDHPHTPFEAARALANAPQREGDFFKVPAILDPAGGA